MIMDELNRFIAPPKHIHSGFDRVNYYGDILRDIVRMCKIIDDNRSEIKMLNPNPNTNLLNETILTAKESVGTYRYLTTVTNMIHFIYPGTSREYGVLINMDKGFKYTNAYIENCKKVLKYVKLPEHYLKAIQYQNKKTKDRIAYINKILEEWIQMTPLNEYRKTLPEGTSLIDDIWEHVDITNTDWKDPEERERVIREYMEHIMQFTDIKSETELRKHYLKQQEKREEQRRISKEDAKRNKLAEKRELANEIANKAIRDIRIEWSNTDPNEINRTWEKLHDKALHGNIKNPKIYILVSASCAGTRRPTNINFLSDQLKLTQHIGAAKVYSNNDPVPDEIKELYNSYKYGYAEMLLL